MRNSFRGEKLSFGTFRRMAVAGAYQRLTVPWLGVYEMGWWTRDFLRCLKLDVSRLMASLPASVVTLPEHVTHWAGAYGDVRQWALVGTGRTDGPSEVNEAARFIPGKEYQALRGVFLWAYGMGLRNMRLNLIGPESGLRPHRENVVERGEGGTLALRVRFHLPILAFGGAYVGCNTREWDLDEGTVYYFNNGAVHWARNMTAHVRVHLVWDATLSPTLWRLMGQGERSGEHYHPTGEFCGPDSERSKLPDRFEVEGKRIPWAQVREWAEETAL